MKARNLFGATALLATQLFAAASAEAAVISYNNFSKADNSEIVHGNGLQWLSWTNTNGLSINDALAKYKQDGWRLASNLEMAGLMNNFKLGLANWTASEQTDQSAVISWVAGEGSVSQLLIQMFGATMRGGTCGELGRGVLCYQDKDPLTIAAALFGSDDNQNGKYNTVQVIDDASYVNANGSVGQVPHQAALWRDIRDSSVPFANTGVALVRTVNNVPAPTSLALIGLGLLALRLRRNK